MTISFRCPSCDRLLKVKDALAGRRGKCPNCLNAVTVPEHSDILLEDAGSQLPSAGHEATPEGPDESAAEAAPREAAGEIAVGAKASSTELAPVFKMLADKNRIAMLSALADGPKNVGALCEMLSAAQPTVSHHLGLMRAVRLVASRRQGKQVFYDINRPCLRRLMEFLERLG